MSGQQTKPPGLFAQIGGGVLLLLFAWWGFDTCFCGDDEKEKPKAATQARANPKPMPAPLSPPKCAALLDDATFLESVYDKVTGRRYRATAKNCKAVTEEVNGRFNAEWSKARGITPLAQPREHEAATAGRTFGVSGSEIALALACDGNRKLRRLHGAGVVAAYDRDIRRYIAKVRSACGDKGDEGRARGNNEDAVSAARGILTLLKEHARHFDIKVVLKGDEAGLKKGMPLKKYRESVSRCRAVVRVSPEFWPSLSESSKKDLPGQFAIGLRTLYGSCRPVVQFISGIRDVATARWDARKKAPTVVIK